MGVHVELHHHEVGTAGQSEIDLRFDTLAEDGGQDDEVQVRHQERGAAERQDGDLHARSRSSRTTARGCTATSSSGRGTTNLFYDERGYAGVSENAIYYIGGLLKHAPSILAFAAPTTNSYRRLVPGYEAPINLIYSQRNRSACVRIPMYSSSPKAKRIEFRPPDPSREPVPGVLGDADGGPGRHPEPDQPPEPIDKDLYDLEPEEKHEIKNTPGSLNEVLGALEADHQFLLQGGVFTQDVIDTWISYKRSARRSRWRCGRIRTSSTCTSTSDCFRCSAVQAFREVFRAPDCVSGRAGNLILEEQPAWNSL